MPRPHLLIPVGLFVLLTTGCQKAETPAQQPAEPPPTPKVAVTPQHMQDHFTKVTEVEEAVIRGDLEGAQAPAKWFIEHQEVTGTERTERPLQEMKAAAQTVATATTIEQAASGAAAMVGACGRCHSAAKVEPKLPIPTERTGSSDRERQMIAHQHAVDLMYRGLAAPVSGDWHRGAEALKKAPLRAGAFKNLTKEITAAEASFKEAADRALKAPDQATRINVYGSIIASCAQCHGLHGRVWGPGLAKTTN